MFRGSDTETQPCGASVCVYPRQSCCSGFVKVLNRAERKYDCVSVFIIHKNSKQLKKQLMIFFPFKNKLNNLKEKSL